MPNAVLDGREEQRQGREDPLSHGPYVLKGAKDNKKINKQRRVSRREK